MPMLSVLFALYSMEATATIPSHRTTEGGPSAVVNGGDVVFDSDKFIGLCLAACAPHCRGHTQMDLLYAVRKRQVETTDRPVLQ